MTIGIKDKLRPDDISYKPMVIKWLLTDDLTLSSFIGTSDIGYNFDFVVDWGDGTTAPVTAWDDSNNSHTYATSGIKTVTITGLMERFVVNTPDKPKLISILKGYF